MAKSTPSKAALSKAGKTLASDGSSKGAKSKAGAPSVRADCMSLPVRAGRDP